MLDQSVICSYRVTDHNKILVHLLIAGADLEGQETMARTHKAPLVEFKRSLDPLVAKGGKRGKGRGKRERD